MITGSKELIRDINSTLVLETIINKGPISRANISKVLGLTKTTVSSIVAKLIEKKFVLEVGSDNTKLGRKPILLAFNANAGYVVSIEIGVDQIVALQSNLLGEKIKILEQETPNNNDGIREALVEIIDSINQEAKPSTYGLIGVTLGIHGVIHNDQISFAPYYALSEFDLSSFLKQRFNTKIFIENEANLSVLGEISYIPKYKNIANISVHSGVGLGLFINGDLYTGFSGYAGEIGHTIVDVDGRNCPCGNKGCLEQYLSEKALLKEFKEAAKLDYVDFDILSSMYKLADKDALAIFQKFVKYMTICINNILNLYNPDIVIINSSFTHHYPELTKEIELSLNSRLNDVLHIYPSSLHHTSVLLGGVSVAVKDFLDINDLSFVNK